jgi:uncharacterized protein YjiS (DUF1127 family)
MTTYTENYTQGIVGNLAEALGNFVQRLRHWARIQQLKNDVKQERQQLLEMSDAMLADLGVTWDQARGEARKVDLPVVRIEILDREAG